MDVGEESGCECCKEQGASQGAFRPSGLQHCFVGDVPSVRAVLIKVEVHVVHQTAARPCGGQHPHRWLCDQGAGQSCRGEHGCQLNSSQVNAL